MAVPTGEIVARPMVARSCGCECEFQHYAVDRYRTQRLAKFQSTQCGVCVAKAEEERRKIAASLPTKGESLQALPPGSVISMTRRPDGNWAGTLTAEGKKVEAVADGPPGMAVALARLWLAGKTPAAK